MGRACACVCGREWGACLPAGRLARLLPGACANDPRPPRPSPAHTQHHQATGAAKSAWNPSRLHCAGVWGVGCGGEGACASLRVGLGGCWSSGGSRAPRPPTHSSPPLSHTHTQTHPPTCPPTHPPTPCTHPPTHPPPHPPTHAQGDGPGAAAARDAAARAAAGAGGRGPAAEARGAEGGARAQTGEGGGRRGAGGARVRASAREAQGWCVCVERGGCKARCVAHTHTLPCTHAHMPTPSPTPSPPALSSRQADAAAAVEKLPFVREAALRRPRAPTDDWAAVAEDREALGRVQGRWVRVWRVRARVRVCARCVGGGGGGMKGHRGVGQRFTGGALRAHTPPAPARTPPATHPPTHPRTHPPTAPTHPPTHPPPS